MPRKRTTSCVYIYLLLDPETLRPFYVGQTCYFKERMSRHTKLRHRSFTPEIIAVVAPHEADDEERYWIASLRQRGYAMENKTTGGQHAYVMDAEVREKIGARHRGMKRSVEAIAKMSAARMGIILPPETRARIGLAVRARWEDPESAERMRQGLVKGKQFHRTYQTDITRARISAATKGVPKSAETRARMSEAQRNRPPRTQEARERMSAAQKKRFETSAPWNKGRTGIVVSAKALEALAEGRERRLQNLATKAQVQGEPLQLRVATQLPLDF
jgi:hypothetical protein